MKWNSTIGLGGLACSGTLPLVATIIARKAMEKVIKKKSLEKGIYLSNTDSINKMMEVTEYYNGIWNYEWED